MKSAFAKNMIRARKVWDMTQETAAAKMKIPRATLASYERGLYEPKFEILQRIVTVYKIRDVLEFIGNYKYFDL